MSVPRRLLYVSGYPFDGESGFAEHIREIAIHLARQKWHVVLVSLTENRDWSQWFDITPESISNLDLNQNRVLHKAGAFGLWRVINRVTSESNFDVAYIRPARKTIFIPKLLYHKHIPIFFEVNTNTVGESRSFGYNWLSTITADYLERLQFCYAQGAFCVTEELAEYARGRIPAKAQTWVTGNGFRHETTELAVFNPTARMQQGISTEDTVLTFLGRLGVWQGVDLVVEALVQMPNTWLWIIGDGPERQRLEQLAIHFNVHKRIHWFEYSQGTELQRLLNATDIAIGTLAMHRKQMTEAQSLKVRHYLGVGLPTIIGYKDTLLDDNSPGVFFAHTQEELVEQVNLIKERGEMRNSQYRESIRNFALKNLSWAAIAEKTSGILHKWLLTNR